ncbi:MAG: serine/threonine protein kinase [Planctomycetes bacterium]|nr:serine/threonine protein kinase [Planctomycetota bacterium]
MLAKADQELLELAVRERFLRAEDLPEILAELRDEERSGCGPLLVGSVLYHHRWLELPQLLRLRAMTRRWPVHCPACVTRINAFGVETGQGLLCNGCRRELVVPDDPVAPFFRPYVRASATEEATVLDSSAFPLEPNPNPDLIERTRHRVVFEPYGYDLTERAGQGASGVVYRALRRPGGRVVALKVLRTDMQAHPILVRRFFREARALSHMEHPNLVRGLGAGCAGGLHFLALEWVDGEDLSKWCRAYGAVPPETALRLVRDLASGLAALHDAGVVHRDVKPSNALLRPDGTACVTDLGVARVCDTPRLTRTGQVVGTIPYMSPEQLEDSHAATPKSDLYSLGATLFHLLSGAPPFAGRSAMEMVECLMRGLLPRLDGEALGLSRPVVELVEWMMNFDPRSRPAGAEQVIRGIDALLVAPPTGAGGGP